MKKWINHLMENWNPIIDIENWIKILNCKDDQSNVIYIRIQWKFSRKKKFCSSNYIDTENFHGGRHMDGTHTIVWAREHVYSVYACCVHVSPFRPVVMSVDEGYTYCFTEIVRHGNKFMRIMGSYGCVYTRTFIWLFFFFLFGRSKYTHVYCIRTRVTHEHNLYTFRFSWNADCRVMHTPLNWRVKKKFAGFSHDEI